MSSACESVSNSVPTREEIDRFYAVYAETLDEARLTEWPDFFSENCLYQIIARENYENGYGLCTMQADSKGMILDRVQGILRTQRFGPRYYRRFYSGTRICGVEDQVIKVRQNVLLIQTLIDQTSKIQLCGVAHDHLIRQGERLLFKQRIVVADSELIEDSLIYPL
jgi:3-phenylpropionate/cinnamic acid dioxygenase small subunit